MRKIVFRFENYLSTFLFNTLKVFGRIRNRVHAFRRHIARDRFILLVDNMTRTSYGSSKRYVMSTW